MNRNHFYTYTVSVRTVLNTGEAWSLVVVEHCCNIREVAHKLQKKLDDIRYEKKEIER